MNAWNGHLTINEVSVLARLILVVPNAPTTQNRTPAHKRHDTQITIAFTILNACSVRTL